MSNFILNNSVKIKSMFYNFYTFVCFIYLLGDIDEYDEIQMEIWEIEKATALQEIYADEVKHSFYIVLYLTI